MGHFFSQPNYSVPNSTSSNTVSSPSHPVLVSDHANQTTSPAVADTPHPKHSPTQQNSSSLHLVSQLPHPLSRSTPTSSLVHPSPAPQPSFFHVPRNSRQIILDFNCSLTPESKAKHALLSNDPNENAIALVGMGGVGKTTILRALGRHPQVWTKFPDGVSFIVLGDDASVQKLLDQLETIVTDMFPDFLPKFTHLTAKENTHPNMMEKLVDLLAPKRFLLIFDDVWDLDSTVFKLVDTACKAVQVIDGACCKVLTSTRNEAIGRIPTHDVSIVVSPEYSRRETCVKILCSYAGIDCSKLSSWSSSNRSALDSIIDLCAGLPLALSVAGSNMQELFGRCTHECGPNAIVQYWESLKRNTVQLSVAENGEIHAGLDAAVQSSLISLERGWVGKSITVREMFRSFCVMQKQMCLPLCVIEKLWGMENALAGVRMFSRHSLVSIDQDEGGSVMGIRLHDLVLDVCVEMAEEKEGLQGWHGRLVDGYRASIRTSPGAAGDQELYGVGQGIETEEDEWWELKKVDKYMTDNVVRHLLGAGRVNTALKLLTDYRWIQKMNEDKERLPFQKVIAELQVLEKNLEREANTERGKKIIHDVNVLMRAMKLCMMPYCIKNRGECTYQLFGRLRDVVSESGVAERIVCGIERYGRRPWARSGPGVLRSGNSSLKRVLELDGEGECMFVGAGGEDLFVGGDGGKVWLLNSHDGTVKKTLIDEEPDVVITVFSDRTSGLLYTCSSVGRVNLWKQHKKWRSMRAELEDDELVRCMQVLPSLKKVVLGTDKGRLLVMDMTNGSTIRTIAMHTEAVTSLAIGASGDVMVSGSWDGTSRVWHVPSFENIGSMLEGQKVWVTSVALSADGSMLAVGSWDGSAWLWDVQSGEKLWTSPDGHHSSVYCVLFSGDERFLYSAGSVKTSVWLISNGGRDVSLMHVLLHVSINGVKSLCLVDGSELFGLRGNQIQVWDARLVGGRSESTDAFLPNVFRFAVSEDGITMLTWNFQSSRMEVRKVSDVSERIDRIISIVYVIRYSLVEILAISNDQRFIAYSPYNSCNVSIIDVQNGGTILHTLSDLEQWALSFTSDGKDDPPNSSSFGDSSGTTGAGPIRAIQSLCFSSDCHIISAYAAVNTRRYGAGPFIVNKSKSWNLSSGEIQDEEQLEGESTITKITTLPRLYCNKEFDGTLFQYSPNVTHEQGGSTSTIATVEGNVRGAHYISDTSRMHLASFKRGMCYIDLVTENTQLPPREEPVLPLLPQYHTPRSQTTGTETTSNTEVESDEVYDVFISHAGTDKFTIALPLYNLLIALGFKVFLDRTELRPGENAPEKMIKAMRRAKIAVLILSPEYAARKWPLKELMCFLERFRAGGEQEVIIIPVFYRLKLEDCRDEHTLFELLNNNGENVFMAEEFMKWMATQQELSIGEVLKGLQSLRAVTGIENDAKVTNRTCEEEKAARMKFVENIRDAIVEAMDRLECGRTAGPSMPSPGS